MSYFAESRLRDVCQELVRLLRAPDQSSRLDYLPPLPQEGARRVVLGVQGRARLLLDFDLQSGECRVFRQTGTIPFSLDDSYELGGLDVVSDDGSGGGHEFASGQAFAEALLKELEDEYDRPSSASS